MDGLYFWQTADFYVHMLFWGAFVGTMLTLIIIVPLKNV